MRPKAWIEACVLGIGGVMGLAAAAPPPRALGELPTGYEALVRFEGEAVEVVARGGPPALLVERGYGVKGEAGWVSFTTHRVPGRRLRVLLPEGPLAVEAGSLRLYLPPLTSRCYRLEDRAKAPPPIREVLEAERVPITEEVFALRARTPYHVRVARETYHLPPPGPEGDPEPRSNPVLWVSDLPFLEGQPQRPLTPAGQQHTY